MEAIWPADVVHEDAERDPAHGVDGARLKLERHG
jgi:hypothetical protein